jgi:hypothetical protein
MMLARSSLVDAMTHGAWWDADYWCCWNAAVGSLLAGVGGFV